MSGFQFTNRTNCVVCGKRVLDDIVTTPPVPLFQGCVDSPPEHDVCAEMHWQLCDVCGTAQLANLVPMDLVYQGGHATGLGAAWERHHRELANFVLSHSDGDIIEVGGGGGQLAGLFRSLTPGPVWHILEPNPLITGNPIAGVELVRGFFDRHFRLPPKVRTVVFSHCLEHIYELAETTHLLHSQLSTGGRVLVAWPDQKQWLAKGEPGAINWEHTYYCSIENLVVLFERAGFSLREKRRFGADHSFFLAFDSGGKPNSSIPLFQESTTTRKLVRGYFSAFTRKADAASCLAGKVSGACYASPASVYVQYLFAFGLNPEHFSGILDNSPIKQGRRLYGTTLKVFPPSVTVGHSGTVVLNGGAHTAEMIEAFQSFNPRLTVLNVQSL